MNTLEIFVIAMGILFIVLPLAYDGHLGFLKRKKKLYKNYKGYVITSKPNEWKYYEAYNSNDCDEPMLIDKTFEGIKTQIDEKE